MLDIKIFTLGPVQTNAYLVADTNTGEAVVIDPASDGEYIVSEAEQKNWKIKEVWITHAHFDHIAGVSGVIRYATSTPEVALHKDDFPLWRLQGGAPYFGLEFESGPDPSIVLFEGEELSVGEYNFKVCCAPGHTPGHVIFYCKPEAVAFCGDVIFWGSIGRTDLPGGNYQTLLHSIQTQILTMPNETRLYTGHGPATTVGRERDSNPFLVYP